RVAGAAGDAEDDEVVVAALGLAQDRLLGGGVDAQRRAHPSVVAVAQFGDVLEHRFLGAPRTGAAADAAAAIRPAGRDIECAHPRSSRPRQREAGLGGASRNVRAVDRNEDPADRLVAGGYAPPGEGDRERPVETADDAGDLVAEAAVRGPRMLDADDEQVVALLRLVGDGFRALC